MLGNTDHEDIDTDHLYDDLIKETKEMGPIDVNLLHFNRMEESE